jgi:hypothetical protein
MACVADELSVEVGYGWLEDRVGKDLANLAKINPEPGSVAEAEDAFLEPICRTFHEGIKQPLHSALDHLELVAEALNNRPEPHPYAESTLIRTAITAASTALWMLPADATERRRRVLEFNFRNFDAYLGYVSTHVREVPGVPDEARAWADQIIEEGMPERLQWIVNHVNSLSGQQMTVDGFRRSRTRDTQIVELAAGELDPPPPGGFDAGAHLPSFWRFMSGYAHGFPWPTVGNWKQHGDPHPETGRITVSQKGNPDQLLDAAFVALVVIEKATDRFRSLCSLPAV